MRGHHCSLWGGCDGAAARYRPNAAPLQQPLYAHEWRAGAAEGNRPFLLHLNNLHAAAMRVYSLRFCLFSVLHQLQKLGFCNMQLLWVYR